MKFSLLKTSSMIKASMACGLSLLLATNVSAKETIRVYAASSMTNVIEDLAERFETMTGNDVVTVYGSSSSLARQLVRGAPASVYVSANEKWMQYTVDQQVISSDAVTNVATNQLALVSATLSDAQRSVFDIEDRAQWVSLLNGERLAMGSPDSVPAGIYGKQTLENLGIWDSVKLNIAPTKSVRLALALAERKETPLAIVYSTDAKLSSKVNLVHQFTHQLHDPIVYPAAIVSDSDTASKFMDFMLSDEASAVFTKYGFGRP